MCLSSVTSLLTLPSYIMRLQKDTKQVTQNISMNGVEMLRRTLSDIKHGELNATHNGCMKRRAKAHDNNSTYSNIIVYFVQAKKITPQKKVIMNMTAHFA